MLRKVCAVHVFRNILGPLGKVKMVHLHSYQRTDIVFSKNYNVVVLFKTIIVNTIIENISNT